MRKKLFSILALLLTVCSAWADGDIRVYFTDALNWGDVKVYYWSDGPEWPGTAMTLVGTDGSGNNVYEASIPDGVTGIIFNDGKNSKQTPDITIGIENGAWWKSKDGGSVSVEKLTLEGKYIFAATVTGVNNTDWMGSEIHPVPVVTLGGNVLSSTNDYGVTYSDGCTNVGTYTVTITGKNDYVGTRIVNFNINNAYFLVGSFNEWQIDQSYKLVANAEAEGEYYINGVQLSANVEFKVNSAAGEWFPNGMDNNYVISNAGIYDIYFRPNGDGGSDWHEGYIYAAESVGGFDVALAPTGYGTFYCEDYEATLPSGVVAYIVTDATPTYEVIADGSYASNNTVPAGTAVLLYSETVKTGGVAANVTLTLTPSSTLGSYTNLLHGSDIQTTTTGGGDGTKYYKLTYGSTTEHASDFGWYWGADNGAAFTSPAHKAWLAVPVAGSRAFVGLPGDDATGIATIENKQQNADNVWYDLNGRRIKAPTTKGIYIKNGRKLVIK